MESLYFQPRLFPGLCLVEHGQPSGQDPGYLLVQSYLLKKGTRECPFFSEGESLAKFFLLCGFLFYLQEEGKLSLDSADWMAGPGQSFAS
jgi:hypothetical protein